ncbi:hypothetical protein F444_10570, partial [Phytophthora nicotianae P1976]
MLQRVVGRAPVVSELPNVSYIRSLPDLTPRDQRKLKRSGIDQDELTAAFLGIQMISTIAPPPQPPKRTRTFMDGGVLMTRPKMMAAVLEAQRRQKVEERVIKAREGQEKREIQEQAAILKQFEKERRQQEKNKKNKVRSQLQPGQDRVKVSLNKPPNWETRKELHHQTLVRPST